MSEEISRLEKIIDLGSAVGTVGVIGGAAAILSRSMDLGLVSSILIEGGYLSASVAGLIHKYKNKKVHNPRLYWMTISVPAAIIDTIYGMYFAQEYALPAFLNWISQTF